MFRASHSGLAILTYELDELGKGRKKSATVVSSVKEVGIRSLVSGTRNQQIYLFTPYDSTRYVQFPSLKFLQFDDS